MCQDLSETIPAILNLGELRSRLGRQFSNLESIEDGKAGGSVSETNIAMSLVDALQKWADALEAQIAMMREEVAGLKTSNTELTEKVSGLEMDKDRLSGEVGHLTNRLDELTGKMGEVHEGMTVVEGLKDDIVVMSSSFGDFLSHFNNYSLAVMSNYSSVTEELSSTVTSIRGLYSTITSVSSESQTTMKNLSVSLSKISSHMFDMESGLVLYKNYTLQRIETIEKEVENMAGGMVNKSMVEKLVAHISEEISDIRISSVNNFTVITDEVKGMATAFHHTLYNASFLIFADVEEIKIKADKLAFEVKDLKKFDQTMHKDMMSISSTLEFVSTTNDDRWTNSELKLSTNVDKLDELTNSLANVDLRLRDLESLAPSVNEMNFSLSESLGALRSNVTHLDQVAEDLKSGLFKMESLVMMTEISTAANSNATLALQTRVRKVEETVGDVQGNLLDFQSKVADLSDLQKETSLNTTLLRGSFKTLESGLMELGRLTKNIDSNSTRMQVGYRGLERHYIELKRDMFETQLQVVSLNLSLNNSVGDMRQDLMSVGSAIANSTAFLTKRIDQVSSKTGVIKDEVAQVWNRTLFLDEKMARFMNNYNHTSGNLMQTMTRFRDELGKNHNRTSYLEFALTGMMNFSLEIESNVKVFQDNVTYCVHAIREMNLNTTDLAFLIKRLNKIQSHQSHLISENTNNIEGNVTRLSLAANLLETELSRVASAYNTLKQALSNQIQSVGVIEVNVQKMSQESLTIKNEMDSLKFEITSVKSETTGLNVFVASMQNHITDLTSNMTDVAQNISVAMDQIEDMKEHLMTVDVTLDTLNGNVSHAMNSIGSNGAQVSILPTVYKQLFTKVFCAAFL